MGNHMEKQIEHAMETLRLVHTIYTYIYMYICVCVCVCVFPLCLRVGHTVRERKQKLL